MRRSTISIGRENRPGELAAMLREDIEALIATIRDIPEERRTPAMQRLLDDLTEAVDQYDNGGGR